MNAMKQYETSGEEGLPIIKVSFSNLMSRPLYYPENDFAVNLARLMRRKSFTKKEIDDLRSIGFIVETGPRNLEVPEIYK